MTRRGVRAWLVGVVAGLAIGLLATALGALGFLLAGALVVGAAITKPRLAALGGTLVGLGLGYPVLALLANARCDPATCEAPDLTAWVAIDVLVLVAGMALSIAAWRASRNT